MAVGERRLFVFCGIFELVLFVICICFTPCSGNDPQYFIAGEIGHSSANSIVSVKSHRVRRDVNTTATPASNTQSPNSATGPDAVTNGNGGQTLPDSPNSPGSSTQPTGSTNTTANTTDANTTQPPAIEIETTNIPTTTENPFQDADILHDHHTYYTTKAVEKGFDNYYINISTAKKHETLSTSHRVAAVIRLKFDFPFYGHPVKNVTVATGGFIYMSPFLHQWLTATQYIAPLMANFDPSSDDGSHIYYLSEEDMLTVEWRNVYLQDQRELGNFTFQTSLYINGSVSFVYKDIPVSTNKISEDNHPVKIGLSDAYYNDTYLPQYGIRRRTIYEYHQVVLKRSLVKTGSVIFVNPVPTCNMLNDCKSCTEHIDVKFQCKWCNTIGRCSDGLDWYRQHWEKYCQQGSNTNQSSDCTNLPPPSKPIVHPIPSLDHHTDECADGSCRKSSKVPVAVIVIVIVMLLALVGGVGGWTYYAYTHPTSKSGMWLMEHRPSQIKAKIKFWKSSSSSDSGAKYRAETDA